MNVSKAVVIIITSLVGAPYIASPALAFNSLTKIPLSGIILLDQNDNDPLLWRIGRRSPPSPVRPARNKNPTVTPHSTNKSPSNLPKHESGQTRKTTDRPGGEKGDDRRPYQR